MLTYIPQILNQRLIYLSSWNLQIHKQGWCHLYQKVPTFLRGYISPEKENWFYFFLFSYIIFHLKWIVYGFSFLMQHYWVFFTLRNNLKGLRTYCYLSLYVSLRKTKSHFIGSFFRRNCIHSKCYEFYIPTCL